MIDERIEAYAEAHTTPLDPFLARLLEAAARELPYPEMLSGPVVGRLLETLVFAVRPRLVLEIGTYAGFSALAMAPALPEGGRIVSLELVDEHADFAQRWIDESPYADRIEIRRGPASESLAAIDEPLDLVFIDADKTGYLGYYEAVVPRLSAHAVLAADNTLRQGSVLEPDDEGGRAIAAFNDRAASDERVVATLLTVRDGVTLVRPRG